MMARAQHDRHASLLGVCLSAISGCSGPCQTVSGNIRRCFLLFSLSNTYESPQLALLVCIKKILKLQYAGTFAILLVSSPPRLNLAFFAAIPLGPALGALLVFFTSLGLLEAVGTETLSECFPCLQLLPRVFVSRVTRFPQPEERSWHRIGSILGIASVPMFGQLQK